MRIECVQPRKMDNPEFLKLVLVRMDPQALKAVSRTPVWNEIVPLLADNNMWRMRAQALVNFELPEDVTDWHQVYNILLDANEINPFSKKGKLHLAVNGFNLVAVKLLLRMGFDPSVDGFLSLISAVRYGSPEAVKLMLSVVTEPSIPQLIEYTSRVEILEILVSEPRVNSNESIHEAILEHIGDNKLEAVKFLLSRMQEDEDFYSYLQQAVDRERIDILQLLLDSPLFDPEEHSQILVRAAGEGSQEITKMLLKHKSLVIVRYISSRALARALSTGKWTIARLLLSDQRIRSDSETQLDLIQSHTMNEHPIPVKLLLENKDLDLKPLTNLLRLAASLRDSHLMSILLEDGRMDTSASTDLLRQALNGNLSREMIDPLVRCKTTDFQKLSEDELKKLGSTKLGSFEENHYDLLLRELTLKHLDLGYYANWMLRQWKQAGSPLELGILIRSAAKSLYSTKPVVHTSPLFTAYSGFFLLANSSDRQAILNTLEQESHLSGLPQQESASREGLRLADLLLKAYLGE